MVKKIERNIILGISAFYHDSAAAIIVNGRIIAAAQEERFTRKKNDSSFPLEAVRYCLEEADIHISDVSAIVFYDKPLLKFERLLETILLNTPRGLSQFVSSMTVWVKEKLFLENTIKRELKKVEGFDPKKCRLLFSEHHLSHAASAYYPSPYEEAAILTMDGVGEWATASIMHGKGREITMLKELRFPHSLGLLYSAFTYFLGFKVNSGEYKLMGLAPYGAHGSEEVVAYKRIIAEVLVSVRSDGSLFLHQEYFNYASGLTMINEKRWEKLFGMPRRVESDELVPRHCNLALAVQEVCEEVMVKMARHAKELTGAKYLTMAGGVALNCVGNSAILRERIFDDVWIQPASGDAGGALGAAFAAYHLYFGRDRKPETPDAMQGAYLGTRWSDAEIEVALNDAKAVWTRVTNDAELTEKVAKLLANGKVVGWFQGRMEYGPRALGARSILADPRNPEMQKKLNLKIKFREGFRPFAPSVLEEDMHEYFEFDRPSPYMLFTAPVQKRRRNPEPSGYDTLDWRTKLYHIRSDIPSVTHLDYSARLQSVSKSTNPLYHMLIKAFKKETGFGLIVNTSFNVRGEPIVCSPMDAYRCFMATHMDVLAIGSYVLLKGDQRTMTPLDVSMTHGTD